MDIKKLNCSAVTACILFVASGSAVSGTMGASVAPAGAIYVGAFGGGGSITSGNLSQEGTALYNYGASTSSINNEGPLAVNAKGEFSSNSSWLVGGHVGYRLPTQLLNHTSPNWTFAPAAELEGYYIGGATLKGDDLNNETARLAEHDFYVTYPMHTGVFLVNAVLTADHSSFGRFHPYVGVGAGTAVVSISGASSIQKTPAEPGMNHYNSGTNDTSFAFAAQPKIGLSFNVNQNTTMFIEYRFLYLSATDYTFGSTVYPTHVATTNWDVKIGSQYYNMGTIGIQCDL